MSTPKHAAEAAARVIEKIGARATAESRHARVVAPGSGASNDERFEASQAMRNAQRDLSDEVERAVATFREVEPPPVSAEP